MKNLNLLSIIFLLVFLSSCNVMLNLSEPFIPEKLDAKIALLEKIQAEPDSLMIYIRNSEFYDEEYSKDIDTNRKFYSMLLESIRKRQYLDYYMVTDGPGLWGDDEFGDVMLHEVMLIHTNTCYGLRLSYVRKYFKWYILVVSHVIPHQICMQRISK